MLKKTISRLILASLVQLICGGIANALVINFDDLSQGLVPNGYAGLTWGTSTFSQPYADFTSFYVSSNLSYSTPYSSPNFVLNGYGVPDLWFEFLAPINFNGAWFAAPINNSYSAQSVRFADDLGRTSEWLNLTSSPQYLAADFLGSKTIYVQPKGIYGGIVEEVNGGWYTMDDITYTETTPVPEPSTIILLISGLAGICIFGRNKFRNGSI